MNSRERNGQSFLKQRLVKEDEHMHKYGQCGRNLIHIGGLRKRLQHEHVFVDVDLNFSKVNIS